MAGRSLEDKETTIVGVIAREILHPENGKIIFHGGIFAIAVWIFGSHGDAIAF
ncbi:hypothetical protein HDU79_000789 [Rhizoclosmatium sp. JEL0117]|nr:hypothetical protein HDU79_000789 [Rhizoclosmatium sp. JEL0117]